MPKISFTKEDKYGHLNAERYELLLCRGELAEEARRSTVKYLLPLIDKRLREIKDERSRVGLSPSDPTEYADEVRDSELEMAEIAAQLKRDDADRI